MYIPIVDTEDGSERFLIRATDLLGRGQTAEVWLGKKNEDASVQRAIKVPNEGSTLADLGALERELVIVSGVVKTLRTRGVADDVMPVPLMWRGRGGEKAPFLLIMELVPSDWRLKGAIERPDWLLDDSESLLRQHLQLLDALHSCGYSTYGDRKMDDLRWNPKSKRHVVIDWNRANKLPDDEPARGQAIKDDLRIMARLLAEAHLGFPLGDMERVPEVDSERYAKWLGISRLARRVIHYCDRPGAIGGYRDARQALEELERGPIDALDRIQRELVEVSDPAERARLELRQRAEIATTRAEHVRAYRDAFEFIGAERYSDALSVTESALQRMPAALDMEQAPHIWLELFHLQVIAKTALALAENGVDPNESDRLLGAMIAMTSRPGEIPPRVAKSRDFQQLMSALRSQGVDQLLEPWAQEIAARESQASEVDGVQDVRLTRAIRHNVGLREASGPSAKPDSKTLEFFNADVAELRRRLFANPGLLLDAGAGRRTTSDEIERLLMAAKTFGPSDTLGNDVRASLETLDWLRTVLHAAQRAQTTEVEPLLDACYAAAQPPTRTVSGGVEEPSQLLEHLLKEARTRLQRVLNGPARPWQLKPLTRYLAAFDSTGNESSLPLAIASGLSDLFDDVRARLAAQADLREEFEKHYRDRRYGDVAVDPAHAVEGMYDSSKRLDPARINWKWVMEDPVSLNFVRRAVNAKVELYDTAPPGGWLVDQVSLGDQTRQMEDLQRDMREKLAALKEEQAAVKLATEELQAWIAANSLDSQSRNPESPVYRLAATRDAIRSAIVDAAAMNEDLLAKEDGMLMARQRIQLLLSDVRANQAMDEWVVKARSHQFDLLFADIVERLRNGDTKGIGDDIKSLGALGDSSQTALVQLVEKAHQELLDDRDLADGLRQHVRDGSAKINDDLRRRIAGAGSPLSLLFDQRIRASDSGEDSLWNLQQVLNRMAADGGRLDQKGNEILAHVTPEDTLISWIAREWVRETELLARRCDTFEALVRPRDSMTPESFSSTRKAQVEAALQFCLVTRASVSEERLKALGKAWERLVDALSLAIAPLEGSGVPTGFGRDIQVLLTVRKASPATGWNTNRAGA